LTTSRMLPNARTSRIFTSHFLQHRTHPLAPALHWIAKCPECLHSATRIGPISGHPHRLLDADIRQVFIYSCASATAVSWKRVL